MADRTYSVGDKVRLKCNTYNINPGTTGLVTKVLSQNTLKVQVKDDGYVSTLTFYTDELQLCQETVQVPTKHNNPSTKEQSDPAKGTKARNVLNIFNF